MKIVTNILELDQHVGTQLGISNWFLVTQEQVDQFADVTYDHQFIHTNPEQAALTPFGGTIAHGFLSLSMLSYFAENGCGVRAENARVYINYGFDKVRFVHPVRVGSKIRAHSTLLSVDHKASGQALIKMQINVEIEAVEKPALIADWLMMLVP